MRLQLFDGLRPFSRSGAIRDLLAGATLASMNIPQVLGYTRIAGTPVITGLYTVLLPNGTGRISHRCRDSGRHGDARRHARYRGAVAPHARSGVGDLARPAAAQY